MDRSDDKETCQFPSYRLFLFSSTCVIKHTDHFFRQKIFLTYLYQEDNSGRCIYKTLHVIGLTSSLINRRHLFLLH